MKRERFLTTLFWLAGGSAIPYPAFLNPSRRIEIQNLRRGTGYFTGRGGTIGWFRGRDATVVVDAQFPPSAEQFHQHLQQMDAAPIDLLINTHHHNDHTAGNRYFRPFVSQIIAHQNVPDLQRLVSDRENSPEPPVVADTMFDSEWSVDLGDETIHLRHHGAGHTSGDAIVHFERADVIHMGDLIFNRWYPFIDREGGASIQNWIQVLGREASRAERDTLYIFGHGRSEFGITGRREELMMMRNFLSALLERTQTAIDADQTLEELLSLNNLAGFEDFSSPGARLSLRANLQAAWRELQDQ